MSEDVQHLLQGRGGEYGGGSLYRELVHQMGKDGWLGSDVPEEPQLKARGYPTPLDQPGLGDIVLEGPASGPRGWPLRSSPPPRPRPR
ncbi:MAG TPA: hypothetical protein VNF50_11695 [Acidimicrobiales bacterium]|nr:hypothetical protein [Acidimicrobiales bacterium]